MPLKVVFLSFLVLAVANGQDPTTSTTPTAPTTTDKPTTTGAPPLTSSSTIPPTTPTTEAPTSRVPTTTTTAIPTTVAPDTPWVVKDSNSSLVCIIAKADLHFAIPYKTKDDKVNMANVEVPHLAVAEGVCNNSSQTLNLTWEGTSFVKFTFNSNSTTKQYWLDSIVANITVTPKLFENITDDVKFFVLKRHAHDFATPVGNSYLCSVGLQLNLTIQDSKDTGRMSLNNLHLDAFHSSNSTSYSSAVECENGQTPDLVPIVMGCVLAALIVVVLLVYLISRKRKQARGYLSM